MKVVVFPGSFDPITRGHKDIVLRATVLFDKIIIAAGKNVNKRYMFSLEQRIQWIRETFRGHPNIEVDRYTGLLVKYVKEKGAVFILRGLRNSADFEFEKAVTQANRKLENELETIFLMTASGLSSVSSGIVRDVIRNNGDYTQFVPNSVRIT